MLKPIVDQRYKIINQLGCGYYSETYLAQDIRRMNRHCIIKRLHPISNEPKTLHQIEQMFEADAMTLKMLSKKHNQIPQIQDYFELNKEFYLVQEIVEGYPISQLLLDTERLPSVKVINILLDILNVLNFAHQHGVIHQDIQPTNLIQRKNGKTILINFGAVKQVHPQLVDTQSHHEIPAYVPDEQIRGEPCFSTDIYALGITAIEALTGIVPNPSQKYLHSEFVCDEQADISFELLPILNKMVRFHVSDRYQSAQEVLDDLEKIRPSNSSNARKSSYQMGTLPKSKKLLVQIRNNCLIGSTVLALGLIGIQVSAFRYGDSSEQHQHNLSPKLQHSAAVHAVTVSPNGQQFASSSLDRTIKLWDLNTGELLRTLEGHTSAVHTIIFSSDGQALASSSHDGTIKLWDLNTGKLIRTFTGHEGHVHSIVFTPDERTLISGSGDGTIKVWDAETGKQIRTLYARSGHVNSVALSPDGRVIASGSREGPVELWDLNTGKQIRSLPADSSYVNFVAITPDGQRLVSSSLDGPIELWNLETGEQIRTLANSSATSLAISPDSQILASNSADQKIKLWNLRTGELLNTFTGDSPENSKDYNSVTFSPDGKTLVSGSSYGAIKVWHLASMGI